jgi:hypothetical protein
MDVHAGGIKIYTGDMYARVVLSDVLGGKDVVEGRDRRIGYNRKIL